MSGIILKAKAILSGIMAAPSSLNGYCSINATAFFRQCFYKMYAYI